LSCGNGTRIRSVVCRNGHGMEIAANNCNLLIRPKEEEKCIGKMCTYKWIASDWSNVCVTLIQFLKTKT